MTMNSLTESSESLLEGGQAKGGAGRNSQHGYNTSPIDERTGEPDWGEIARTAWAAGDEWFNSTMRRRIERNLAHYNMEHEPGSKYNTDAYGKRPRIFRPKTRTYIRKIVAAATKAYFSTADVLHTEPYNESDEGQRLAAEAYNLLLNARLDQDVPWYGIVSAAIQDACSTGTVVSCQEWDLHEETVPVVNFERAPGGMKPVKASKQETLRDRPMARLVPLENIRFAPGSDWLEIAQNSPYIIEQVPYYYNDLKYAMRRKDSKVPYYEDAAERVKGSLDTQYDSIRASREGNTRDRFHDSLSAISADYGIVWVRRCIVRRDGADWYYETTTSGELLSRPVYLREVHKIGRPYVIGCMEIEPHVLYKSGTADLNHNQQTEMNNLANNRLENVLLAMQGRFLVARGGNTDIRSLMRLVAGSVTFTNSPNGDVKDLRPADVTSSSYEEQDRLNNDADELNGMFSQGTVSGQRNLNETVGGMLMLSESASEVMESQIKTFTETWYKPVLGQMVELERHYESDARMITMIGEQLARDSLTVFRALNERVKVTVNVGFGNLNPIMRIEKLTTGMSAIEQLAPGTLAGADSAEIAKEIFGALGYKDGKRFLPHLGEEDGQFAQMQQQIQELEAQLADQQAERDNKLQIAELNGKLRLAAQEMAGRYRNEAIQLQNQLKAIELELKKEDREIERRKLALQREALSNTILNTEREFEMQLAQMGMTPADIGFQINPTQQQLASDLRDDGGSDPGTAKPVNIDDRDLDSQVAGEAGTLARDKFGMVPFVES